MKQQLNLKFLLCYSFFSIPLSFIGLPLYINLPKLYAEHYKISLIVLGNTLLFLRIFDAVLDPLIGLYSDKFQLGRKLYLFLASISIVICFNALFWMPQYFATFSPALWFAFFTSAVYFCFSFININFYATGFILTDDYQQRTKISAFREAAGLFGILIAAIIPSILQQSFSELPSFQIYGLIFALLIFLAIFLFPNVRTTVKEENKSEFKKFLLLIKEKKQIAYLYLIFFVNSLPVAITSTLFLFYVENILKLKAESGLLLALYFLTAALSTPLWSFISTKIQKRRTLITAIIISLFSFIWSYFLNESNSYSFYMICLLSGIGLGGEMVIFPSLLADLLSGNEEYGNSSFGIWQALSKISLGVAAGLVLPLLSSFGFDPNGSNSQESLKALTVFYSIIPLTIKSFALLILLFSSVDKKI